ncbi:hypothetical protein PYW08_002767 [Mythimna loreyi]|uniref:Uncharacterized protein n=1 Tax=Mythimna loreyi TaxID=667449 RepID=A0ACC2QLD6_9NEOP|nr:hypothetical protein PYW08_002767 [Mythimna loreyi]
MARIHITRRHNGNWIINLSVLLCNLNIIISKSCNNGTNIRGTILPLDWPCEWNSGEIPFAFNFYSIGLKRLMTIVKRAHSHLEKRSCLKFKELDPRWAKGDKNFTFLYYNFSGVLESCCLQFYKKPVGRRMVLITPVCSLPAEAAHATLHGMGLWHRKHEPFNEGTVRGALFYTQCHDLPQKLLLFDTN